MTTSGIRGGASGVVFLGRNASGTGYRNLVKGPVSKNPRNLKIHQAKMDCLGLHRPMYILLVNLALNGVIGSSSVCPTIMKHLIMEKQETSLEGCLTQVYFSHVYASCVYCILALMAYDRYVSICKPLQYHSIMTPTKVKLLLAVVYFIPGSALAVQVYMTSRIQLCKHTIDKLLCDNQTVINLSCQKNALLSVYGLCLIICLTILPFLLVVLSYVNIFMVSLKTSKESQKKALRTCTPHLVTFINFSVASFLVVIYNRISLDLPKQWKCGAKLGRYNS
ncbi:olfactory receptor 4B13-like [Polymixia lowei]